MNSEDKLQDIYDRVVSHMREQMASTKRNGRFGAYELRTHNRKSPIGFLIKDKFYSEDLEQFEYNSPEVLEALGMSGISATEEIMGLIDWFQTINDTYDPDDWEAGFREAAEMQLLEYKPIKSRKEQMEDQKQQTINDLHTSAVRETCAQLIESLIVGFGNEDINGTLRYIASLIRDDKRYNEFLNSKN